MSAEDIFGAIVTGRDVEQALEATVRLWAPDYIAEISQQSGRDRRELAMFASYVNSFDLEKFDEDQTPCCILVSNGILRPPKRHGTGKYEATYGAAVGVVVTGQDQDNTVELVQLYAAAVRAMVVQHPSLGGFSSGVSWIGERYDPLPVRDTRTIAAGAVEFEIVVGLVVDAGAGPVTPSDDPTTAPAALGTIRTVTITADGRN